MDTKNKNWKLFIEQYYEILLAAALGVICILEGGEDMLWGTVYDFPNSLTTFLFLGYCAYFPIWATITLI